MNPPSKLAHSGSSGSLSGSSTNPSYGESSRLRSPSATSFFSNIGHSLTNHSRDSLHSSPSSLVGSSRVGTTPPSSPNTLPSANSSSTGSIKEPNGEPTHLYGRYAIKYIGSTALRRRHTLPMLNWIVTDLLTQSKCDGDELHIAIRNCMREEASEKAFERLRSQLSKDTHHGLSVHFDLCQLPTPTSTATKGTTNGAGPIAFQVSNLADGQILLNHLCRRVFLFGKFTRESSLFFYLHKDQDDGQAVPTLYVFQAVDDTQLSDIYVKYNELRPKLNLPNDKHLFLNSLNAKTGITSNCFEVLHIGSVMVSQKRADPSLVDRAAKEFRKRPEKVEEEDDTEQSEEKTTEAKEGNLKAPPKSIPISTNNGPRRQFKANRFLVEVIDENEALEYSSSPESSNAAYLATSPTTLISNTQSLDCETRASLLKELKQHQGLQHQLSDMGATTPHIRDLDFGGKADLGKDKKDNLLKAEREEILTKGGSGLKRSSSGETTMKKDTMSILSQMDSTSFTKKTNVNKTMLFIIGQLDICLISSENHKTVFSKTFSNISHCSQGITCPDHFGIIVREPFGPNSYSETYVAHIFKCSTPAIVNELLGSLRQSFNNAYRASKLRQNGTVFVDKDDLIVTNEAVKPDHPYCDNCPMNWFHQLCLDIDGLDNGTIFVLLMFRIEQHSSAEKREEFHSILKRINFTDPRRKVDILMSLLKARAERMQKRHELSGCRLNSMNVYDQCDVEESDSRSTASLTRLEGLKMMAKSSLTNIFKMNKNFTSTESLTSAKPLDQWFPPGPSTPPTPNSSQTTFSSDSNEPSLSVRRNTLPNCCPENAALTLNPDPKKEFLHQKVEKAVSLGKTEEKSLLNIFMKVSGSQTKVNSMEELSANLNQMENEPMDGPPVKSGVNLTNKIALMERQSSVNSQLRHKLFKRIKKSIREFDLTGSESNKASPAGVKKPLTPGGSIRAQRRRNPRSLWKFAIRQQILLIQMNKQNDCNKDQTRLPPKPADNKLHLEYEPIPRLESPQHLEQLCSNWDRIMSAYQSGKNPISNLEESIYRAIREGIPRNRKRAVWQFLAEYRRKGLLSGQLQTAPPPSKMYRKLLRQLTVQQHAIFVDLGRTFPNVSYFAESMGHGQLALFNLLKAYSLYDKEVEYCQGLSFVAGILLLHMSEDDAFDLMVYVLYDCRLREQYKPDMEALQLQMYQFVRLLYDRNRLLHDHLERHEVYPTLYAAPCFLTLFASQFSIAFVSRVFDFLIFLGIESIFRIFFALIERISDRLLSCDDFESLMELLRVQLITLEPPEMERIFASIHEYDFTKQLEQYRVEYKILQEEFAHLSLMNSKSYTSQPNVNREEAGRQPSVDRFLDGGLSGSNESIEASRRARNASELPGTVSRPQESPNLEISKLKADKEHLASENALLRESLIQLERRLSVLHASNRQFEADNEVLQGTVSKLNRRVKTLEDKENHGKHLLHTSHSVPEIAQPKRSSDSDDDKCFVYVDATEFPDPL